MIRFSNQDSNIIVNRVSPKRNLLQTMTGPAEPDFEQNRARALLVLTNDAVKNPQLVEMFVSEYQHHQLLDRISQKAVELEPNSFDLVHVLGTAGENVTLDQTSADAIFAALVPNGRLEGQIDTIDSKASLPLLLAGFVGGQKYGESTFIRPEKSAVEQAPVALRRKANPSSTSKATTTLPTFKRLNKDTTTTNTTNTMFSGASASSGDSDDDEESIIDEDELMASEVSAPIVLPPQCDPGPGKKRRKACKDCTCGLKELEEEELNQQQAKQNTVVTLSSTDMAEVDFTVPGKAVGGCGSCALGDAFRCDGCPYLGLPPFKPGEVVSLNMDDL